MYTFSISPKQCETNNNRVLRKLQWNAVSTNFLLSNKSNEVVFFNYLTNSSDLNPVDYSIWGLIQERVYQAEMLDINDLKQRLVSFGLS